VSSNYGLLSLTSTAIQQHNQTNYGTICLVRGNMTMSNVTMRNCKATSGRGGAVAILATSSLRAFVTILYSTFTQNSVLAGAGGAIYNERGRLTLRKSYFIRNTATTLGGAIYGINATMAAVDT
jgi:predicted outer membrane repeat protein